MHLSPPPLSLSLCVCVCVCVCVFVWLKGQWYVHTCVRAHTHNTTHTHTLKLTHAHTDCLTHIHTQILKPTEAAAHAVWRDVSYKQCWQVNPSLLRISKRFFCHCGFFKSSEYDDTDDFILTFQILRSATGDGESLKMTRRPNRKVITSDGSKVSDYCHFTFLLPKPPLTAAAETHQRINYLSHGILMQGN